MDILNFSVAAVGYAAIISALVWLAWLLFQELVMIATKEMRANHKRASESFHERVCDISRRLSEHTYNYKHEEATLTFPKFESFSSVGSPHRGIQAYIYNKTTTKPTKKRKAKRGKR